MDVSKIGEPHQNLGNHLEISTTQPRVNRLETYLLEVPWSLHLDNKMHEIDHGKRMQVRKAPRTRRGGGGCELLTIGATLWSIFKQDYWWLILPRRRGNTSIKKWVRGTTCLLCTSCCDSSFGMMQVLLVIQLNPFCDQIFHAAPSSFDNLMDICQSVWLRPSKCRSTSTDAAFRRVLQFWSPKQVLYRTTYMYNTDI